MSNRPSNDVIFEEALAKPTPEACAAYLDMVCHGDDNLRQLMARLVAAHIGVGQFLEAPAAVFGHRHEIASDLAQSIDAPRGAGVNESVLSGLLSPTERSDSLGKLGSLEVIEVVARGGMGIVLRGFDAKLNREVAIKLLPPEVAANADARRRFVREARGAAAVVHENVIAIYAVDDTGVLPYLVMPFIEGRSLHDLIRLEGPLPAGMALRIGAKIAAGLAAVHESGLIHRDLKPANILIEHRSGQVKITDFGVARAVDDPHATQLGVVTGTPAFMSPEQAAGQPVDHRTDLFSLGSVLYAMCAGRPPFDGETAVSVIRQVCDHSPRPLREVNPAVPAKLAELVTKLHSRDPAARPQSAIEVTATMTQLLDLSEDTHQAVIDPTPGADLSPKRRSSAFGRRSRMAAILGLLVALAMGAAEATGVTDLSGTVVRLVMPEGTLVVEVDDPDVRVTLEGTDLVITGTGAQEIRLKPGSYQLRASRDGKLFRQEIVTVSRNGRQIVRVSNEVGPVPDEETGWQQRVEKLPPEEQVAEVRMRLMARNPGYDGKLDWGAHSSAVVRVKIDSAALSDISPLRAFRYLTEIHLQGPFPGRGKVTDLRPLRGLPLRILRLHSQPISDLEPLRGMNLEELIIPESRVADLSPLQGMKLRAIGLQRSKVTSLEPLRGMPLEVVDLYMSSVNDLSPLKGMPLYYLNIGSLPVSDSDFELLPTFKGLKWLIMQDVPIRDISHLRSLQLHAAILSGTKVEDLSPLLGMPLQDISLDYRPDRAEFLRSFPKLTRINAMPAEKFWAEVEKLK